MATASSSFYSDPYSQQTIDTANVGDGFGRSSRSRSRSGGESLMTRRRVPRSPKKAYEGEPSVWRMSHRSAALHQSSGDDDAFEGRNRGGSDEANDDDGGEHILLDTSDTAALIERYGAVMLNVNVSALTTSNEEGGTTFVPNHIISMKKSGSSRPQFNPASWTHEGSAAAAAAGGNSGSSNKRRVATSRSRSRSPSVPSSHEPLRRSVTASPPNNRNGGSAIVGKGEGRGISGDLNRDHHLEEKKKDLLNTSSPSKSRANNRSICNPLLAAAGEDNEGEAAAAFPPPAPSSSSSSSTAIAAKHDDAVMMANHGNRQTPSTSRDGSSEQQQQGHTPAESHDRRHGHHHYNHRLVTSASHGYSAAPSPVPSEDGRSSSESDDDDNASAEGALGNDDDDDDVHQHHSLNPAAQPSTSSLFEVSGSTDLNNTAHRVHHENDANRHHRHPSNDSVFVWADTAKGRLVGARTASEAVKRKAMPMKHHHNPHHHNGGVENTFAANAQHRMSSPSLQPSSIRKAILRATSSPSSSSLRGNSLRDGSDGMTRSRPQTPRLQRAAMLKQIEAREAFRSVILAEQKEEREAKKKNEKLRIGGAVRGAAATTGGKKTPSPNHQQRRIIRYSSASSDDEGDDARRLRRSDVGSNTVDGEGGCGGGGTHGNKPPHPSSSTALRGLHNLSTNSDIIATVAPSLQPDTSEYVRTLEACSDDLIRQLIAEKRRKTIAKEAARRVQKEIKDAYTAVCRADGLRRTKRTNTPPLPMDLTAAGKRTNDNGGGAAKANTTKANLQQDGRGGRSMSNHANNNTPRRVFNASVESSSSLDAAVQCGGEGGGGRGQSRATSVGSSKSQNESRGGADGALRRSHGSGGGGGVKGGGGGGGLSTSELSSSSSSSAPQQQGEGGGSSHRSSENVSLVVPTSAANTSDDGDGHCGQSINTGSNNNTQRGNVKRSQQITNPCSHSRPAAAASHPNAPTTNANLRHTSRTPSPPVRGSSAAALSLSGKGQQQAGGSTPTNKAISTPTSQPTASIGRPPLSGGNSPRIAPIATVDTVPPSTATAPLLPTVIGNSIWRVSVRPPLPMNAACVANNDSHSLNTFTLEGESSAPLNALRQSSLQRPHCPHCSHDCLRDRDGTGPLSSFSFPSSHNPHYQRSSSNGSRRGRGGVVVRGSSPASSASAAATDDFLKHLTNLRLRFARTAPYQRQSELDLRGPSLGVSIVSTRRPSDPSTLLTAAMDAALLRSSSSGSSLGGKRHHRQHTTATPHSPSADVAAVVMVGMPFFIPNCSLEERLRLRTLSRAFAVMRRVAQQRLWREARERGAKLQCFKRWWGKASDAISMEAEAQQFNAERLAKCVLSRMRGLVFARAAQECHRRHVLSSCLARWRTRGGHAVKGAAQQSATLQHAVQRCFSLWRLRAQQRRAARQFQLAKCFSRWQKSLRIHAFAHLFKKAVEDQKQRVERPRLLHQYFSLWRQAFNAHQKKVYETDVDGLCRDFIKAQQAMKCRQLLQRWRYRSKQRQYFSIGDGQYRFQLLQKAWFIWRRRRPQQQLGMSGGKQQHHQHQERDAGVIMSPLPRNPSPLTPTASGPFARVAAVRLDIEHRGDPYAANNNNAFATNQQEGAGGGGGGQRGLMMTMASPPTLLATLRARSREREEASYNEAKAKQQRSLPRHR